MKEYRRIENEDGSIVETYWRDGEKHREDGPAEIERRADGSVSESYWHDGKKHRENGPAEIVRSADGTVIRESYWRNGAAM